MTPCAEGCWQKNPSLAWREVEGETVIISPDESVMHELNGTASFIWRHVDGHNSAAQIAELLASEYDVTPITALKDTKTLLTKLAERRLLVPAESVEKESGTP